ncbi:hypothetical protein JCM21900_005128 [Sporobolomyces salmonicolor]
MWRSHLGKSVTTRLLNPPHMPAGRALISPTSRSARKLHLSAATRWSSSERLAKDERINFRGGQRHGRGALKIDLSPHLVGRLIDWLGAPADIKATVAPLNEVQVPLISPNLRSQLFPPSSSPYAPPPPSATAIEISRSHLQQHGLLSGSAKLKRLDPAIDFTLPRLQGPTLSHHFHALGQGVAEPYLSMARSFGELEVPDLLEQDRWIMHPGWTRYGADGSWESVPHPPNDDETMVFDVETLPYQGGVWPVMAIAAGRSGWYGWCSPWMTGDDDQPNHLIPFAPSSTAPPTASPPTDFLSSRSQLFERPSDRPRLLIGHNVLYDRARIADEYNLRRPSTRYLDTLSLHVAVSGLTNPQRPMWMKHRKGLDRAEAARAAGIPEEEVIEDSAPEGTLGVKRSTPKSKTAKTWHEVSSLNSLAEVARLHCGIRHDKSLRDVFIDPSTTIEEVRAHFDELLHYCARDVQTTWAAYKALLPKFLKSCPHPATFAGVTLMSQPVLPVDAKWPLYLERAESTYLERLKGVKDALQKLAQEARAKFADASADEEGKYPWEDDLWLRQLDWSPKRARRLPGDIPSRKRTQKGMEKAAMELEEAAKARLEQDQVEKEQKPAWTIALDKLTVQSPLAALLFETTWRGFPVVFSHSVGWLFAVPNSKKRFIPEEGETLVDPVDLHESKDALVAAIPSVSLYTVPTKKSSKRCMTLITTSHARKLREGLLGSPHKEFEEAMTLAKADEGGEVYGKVMAKLRGLAETALEATKEDTKKNVWLQQLDWTPVDVPVASRSSGPTSSAPAAEPTRPITDNDAKPEPAFKNSDLIWPKWFWDLDVPGYGLDVSIGKRAAPLLLKLRWKGFSIAYSKQHGWMYRIPVEQLDAVLEADSSLKLATFTDMADLHLANDHAGEYVKLPHPDGEEKNVGSPLSKSFVAAFEDGTLTSEYPVAEAALSLNASCSYWTSARERIMNQMVVWEGDAKTIPPTPAAIASSAASESTQGLILPQVIPMGTVTRRAVERTWLTASNAKKNRVGSELKSMVRAPPGYAIVGADVDSEELWICSVMGDAQFGIHGATAIGWMTLEGTKSAGTDMHSKTASILGISRDDAKVFNYSRIYGAGVKHAVQLLLKSNPKLTTDQARGLAKALYASTKGVVDRSAAFRRNFWHGGTESFVFNKLEGIAQSERPRTPALGCGLTTALTKEYLPAEGRSKAGEGFLPSRINWVVQSSGVDYLHLLLVSMEYLTKRFEIDARYLISVHDEIRYLVKEEDKYRAAAALQIANLWTRSLFAFRLQMPDLPQGCAFFSAVDIDSCFRKEVDMSCVTPSNPDPIPFGESLDITETLSRTSGGSLFPDGRSMTAEGDLPSLPLSPSLSDSDITGEQHRVAETHFLVAQTASSPAQIARLWREASGQPSWASTTAPNGARQPQPHPTEKDLPKKDPPKKRQAPRRFDDDDDDLHPRALPEEMEDEYSIRVPLTRARS